LHADTTNKISQISNRNKLQHCFFDIEGI